jgi:predicted HicB family RNase H-like nuclease
MYYQISRTTREIIVIKTNIKLDNIVCKCYIDNKTNQLGGDSMKTVYLRDFPEDLHRKAKSEAALEGISLKALFIKAVEEYLKKKKRG